MDYNLSASNDIPDFQFHDEMFPTAQHWPFQEDFAFNTLDRSVYGARDVNLTQLHLQIETGNCNLQPMDRFRSDLGPFSSGMALAERKMKGLQVHSPEVSYRQYSPDGTENSSIGCDTFSACNSDDLRQFSQGHRGSLGDSPDLHQGYFLQSQYSPYSAQSPEVPIGGGSSISLSQIQHFEDVDQGYNHSEIDADGESDNEHDNVIVRPPREKLCTRSDDEGLGDSIPDSESLYRSRSVMDDDEDADPEYKPYTASSPRSSRPRRPSGSRRYSHGRKPSNASNGGRISKQKTKKAHNPSAARPFPCPLTGYGCHSTFTSKNEWKRHVSTQHIKLGFWRCDMCAPSADPQNPVYNDFNRKDLFTQHLRRMHTHHPYSIAASQSGTSSTSSSKNGGDNQLSDDAVLAHQQRCYRHLRSSPSQSNCLFCPRSFNGEGTWEERMEHVGAHFERERKTGNKLSAPESWRDDPVLREYLVQEGLIEHDVLTGWHIGDGRPIR
jgi:hypothetical protein